MHNLCGVVWGIMRHFVLKLNVTPERTDIMHKTVLKGKSYYWDK